MSPLWAHMAHYRAEHRTVGCRITHMIGVPIIVASLSMLVWNWRVGLAMFVIGWTMQFAGHRYFERNKPVLMADPKNPLTYVAALIFVAQEWLYIFGGRWLVQAMPQDSPGTTTLAPEPARAA
jgi:uncharacterized membrane protein YGL010W